VLTACAEVLASEGLCRLDPRASAARRAQPVDIEPAPAKVAVRDILGGRDAVAIARACRRFVTDHPVSDAACVCDTEGMTNAYVEQERRVPVGLRYHGTGGAMTPRRIITVLYTGEHKTDAWPPTWTTLRTRVIDRGGDRMVLLAILAWALTTNDAAAARNVIDTVTTVWPITPDRSPGLEELHNAIRSAG
jgi:hypothetical protein